MNLTVSHTKKEIANAALFEAAAVVVVVVVGHICSQREHFIFSSMYSTVTCAVF